MGWSTDLFCNIEFNKETYNTKYEVQSRIEELKCCIQTAKDSVRSLVIMTEPNKFCPEGYDPINWVSAEYNDNIGLIEEYTIELYKLNLLLENWDACHNKEGLAIDPPENIHWDIAFLSGDFIKSIKHPNNSIFNE